MQAAAVKEPGPPRDLRPAQLGFVLLGKVIVGHFSATLTDLAHRGLVGLQELTGDAAQDWLVTDLRGQAAGTLLPFETALLDGLLAGQTQQHLSRLGPELLAVLNRTRVLIRRDAVRQGWYRRLRPGHRTPQGEQLLTEIKVFRQQLRVLAASGCLADRPELAAYATLFGLLAPSPPAAPAEEPKRVAPRDTEARAQESESSRFGIAWQQACDRLPHRPAHNEQTGDFTHHWSAPPSHAHASHGHAPGGSGHGGYGGYAHGGHGGGFAAGGHGH